MFFHALTSKIEQDCAIFRHSNWRRVRRGLNVWRAVARYLEPSGPALLWCLVNDRTQDAVIAFHASLAAGYT